MLPDVDHMYIGVREENLQVRGEQIMFQLCVVPAYALHLGLFMLCQLCIVLYLCL